MQDQLPMQVALMERERQLSVLLRESEVLRALGAGPTLSARLAGWLAGAKGRFSGVGRPWTRVATAAPSRTELGSSAA